MTFHLLVLLSRNQSGVLDQLESLIDFDMLTNLISSDKYNEDEQIFILRCLLELGTEQKDITINSQAYLGAIDSCFVFMGHSCDKNET